MSTQTPCVDHLGNEYPSVKAMCQSWGVNADLYRTRKRKRYTLQDCLRPAVVDNIPTYSVGEQRGPFTIIEICKINYVLVCRTCKHQVNFYTNLLKDTIICYHCSYGFVAWDGVYYESRKALAEAYGKNWSTLKELMLTMSEKEACLYAVRSPTPCVDHLGQKFRSHNARAKAYGLDSMTIKSRLEKNKWDLQTALTTPVVRLPTMPEEISKKLKDFAELTGLSLAVVKHRYLDDWSDTEIIGESGRGLEWRIQHGEQINSKIIITKGNPYNPTLLSRAYTGRDNKCWYKVLIISENISTFMTADMIYTYGE